MRALERILILLALGAVAAIAAMAVSSTRSPSRTTPATDQSAAGTEQRAAIDSAFADSVLAIAGPQDPEVRLERSALAAPERDLARIAYLLQTRSQGGYLRDMLAANDSTNFRWPDRQSSPMRIWVQELPVGTPGWDTAFPRVVREAFSSWGGTGVPIHFTFVLDSARGEIHVTWTDRFEAQMTGSTQWAHDQHRWIVGGNILLALHQPDGRPLTAEAVRAIALHEVGHLVGLDHSSDPQDIMSARVRVTELSEADRRTARLVYALPPGSLKTPR